MSKQAAGLVISCVIVGMVGVVLSARADQVLTGGNISAAAPPGGLLDIVHELE